MATKAELFKAEQQRAAHPPRTASRGSARTDDGSSALPARARQAMAASHLAEIEDDPAGHPRASRRAKPGTYELEVARTTSRPSRKSTRRSPSHLKTDGALSLRQLLRATAPSTRAGQRPTRAH
jgi:hypothetical protein